MIETPFSVSADTPAVNPVPTKTLALALAVTPVASADLLMAAATAIALCDLLEDCAVVAEALSSVDTAAAMLMPLIDKSPWLSAPTVGKFAVAAALARVLVVKAEVPLLKVPEDRPDFAKVAGAAVKEEMVMAPPLVLVKLNVPVWMPSPPKPVAASVSVVSSMEILRPSSAISWTPPVALPVSTARTPVWSRSKLIAVTTVARLTPASAVVVKDAVVTPLIVIVPVRAAAVIEEPSKMVLPTVASTPVWAETLLMAATLAIALAALACEESLSSAASVLRTATPLMTRSPVPRVLAVAAVVAIAVCAVATSAAAALWPLAVTAAVLSEPSEDERMSAMPTSMDWLALLPIWIFLVPKLPSKRFTLLNCVVLATRSISVINCLTSSFRAERSLSLLTPLID